MTPPTTRPLFLSEAEWADVPIEDRGYYEPPPRPELSYCPHCHGCIKGDARCTCRIARREYRMRLIREG